MNPITRMRAPIWAWIARHRTIVGVGIFMAPIVAGYIVASIVNH